MPIFLNALNMSSQQINSLASPSVGTDAVNKDYVDGKLAGLAWKSPGVRVATTTNGVLLTAYENGDSVDGISLVTGDRILLKNQTAQTENGIYVVAATGAPARASDADSSAELQNAAVLVSEGTVNANTAWTQNTDSVTIGVSNIVWAPFGAGQSYTADGNGIELTSTTFGLELDGTSLSKGSSGLRIGSAAAAAGLTESGGLLSVGAGTGITVNANDVAIDTSVAVRKYVTNVGDNSSTTITITHNLGTPDVTFDLWTGTTGALVFCDAQNRSTNAFDLVFATAPTTNQYRVVVHG
jgi:hypothetical protein